MADRKDTETIARHDERIKQLEKLPARVDEVEKCLRDTKLTIRAAVATTVAILGFVTYSVSHAMSIAAKFLDARQIGELWDKLSK